MRKLLSLAAKIAISGALLYFALARVDPSAIGHRLKQADAGWLVALVCVLLFQLLFAALRWQQIGLHGEAPLPFMRALRYTLVASFFNQTLPSTIGGDAARIWLLARTGAGWKAASYSVIVDRVIGLMVLVAIVIVCLPWLLDLVRDPLGRTSLLLANGAAFLGTIAFLLIGLERWTLLQRWWITRHISGAAAVALKVLGSGSGVAGVVLPSIAIHVLTVAAVWCAARAVSAPLEFWQALLLVPTVILIATVPISIAGWGVREGAMMTAFTFAGLTAADGLIVSVLYGAGLFAVGAIGGAIWILSSAHPILAAEKMARES
ncbi:MAG TPA: lysylphosphatidylglycerol synthase transmembrane domain-containing protein [Xanthobacteraceae bacterium]|nr:lysylphosphatidylglycerol synthase transmembrane domain-containing protein [Xanthobacteraceae bacterium]